MPRSEIENHFASDCPFGDANCPMVGECDFQVRCCLYHQHFLFWLVDLLHLLTFLTLNKGNQLRQSMCVDYKTHDYVGKLESPGFPLIIAMVKDVA